MSRPAALLATVSLIAACSSDQGASADSVLRTDSAGVEVVTHTVDLDPAEVEVVGDPVLVIDSDEEGNGAVFFQLTAVVPLADGRLVVGSNGTQTVHVFDRAGGHERTIGGPGEGPGEFGDVSDVDIAASDTVVVLDIRLGRASVFAPSGEVARTVDVAPYLPPSRGARLHIASDALWLVGIASLGGGGGLGVNRDSAVTYRLSSAGDSLDAYGPFPGAEVFLNEQMAGMLPFAATLASGVRGDRLIIGLESDPEVLEFATPDGPARIIRWPDRGREVTSERAEAFVDFQLEALPAPAREQVAPVLRGLPFSPVEPAYYDMVIASDGMIWLGDYPGPEGLHPQGMPPSRTWTLIDSDGVRRRLVRTPPGFIVMAVRDDRIYGAHRDEVGVESVRVYPVG